MQRGPVPAAHVETVVQPVLVEANETPVISKPCAVSGRPAVATVRTRLPFLRVTTRLPPSGSAIWLFAYTSASTTPTFKRSLSLTADPRIPAHNFVRDGLIAVAASDTRVAIVWTSGKTLTDKDPVGGYAVYACSGK